MIRIKKQKGGTLDETRCGKRDDSKHDKNLRELFNKIRKKWIENKKKSVSWISNNDGLFLNPEKEYNEVYEKSNDPKCTDLDNHIHLYNIEEKLKDKKYNLKLFLSIKINGIHINPISKKTYKKSDSNQNFIIEYNILLCDDKQSFNINNIGKIICDELLKNYNLAKEIK
jgi:hypothetical protein